MINRAYIEIAKIYSEYYSLENSQLSNINFLFEQILKNQDILIDIIDELTRYAK